jgi:hypothetical protein
VYPHNTVVQDGKVIGVDPDAFIRSDIQRGDNSAYHSD